MKSPAIFLTAALALGGAALAQTATTNIYISGAPALRQTSNQAIYDTLTALSGGATIYTYADAGFSSTSAPGATFVGANQVNFYGGVIGGTPVNVKVSWSGSTAGR